MATWNFFVRLAMETMIERRSSSLLSLSQAVGAGKIFVRLYQSCRWLGGIFRIGKQSIFTIGIPFLNFTLAPQTLA